MANTPDGLFDTSEPALSNRIARFQRRVKESPIDRAAFALLMAVEDLQGVLLLAQTPEEYVQIQQVSEEAIGTLSALTCTALTLNQYFGAGK